MASSAPAPVGYTAGTSFNWNTKGQVVSAAVILPVLGIIVVGMRFWSRIHRKTGFGWDDFFIFPALLCVIGLGVDLLVGVGKHVIAHTTPPDPNTSPEAQLYQITAPQELVEKIEFVFVTLMIPAYGFVKLSVIFFYRRIFVKGTYGTFDWVTKIAAGIVTLWTIAFFLFQIFKCGSFVSGAWGPLIDAEHCKGGYEWQNALYISDLITDFIVICLPIPIITTLNMSTGRKVAVIGILLLGTMSFCASIVRVVYGWQISVAGYAYKTDVDEGLTTLLYWGMLEAGISLIATNLPSLNFLLSKKSLQSMIASVRSQISLGSIRSHESKKSQPYSKMGEHGSMSSHAPAVPAYNTSFNTEPKTVDSFAMHEYEDGLPLAEPGEIHVRSDIKQTDNMV